MPGIFSYLDLFPAMTENCSARVCVCVCVGGKKGHDSAIDIGNSFNKQTTTGPITCVLVMVSAPGSTVVFLTNPIQLVLHVSGPLPNHRKRVQSDKKELCPSFFTDKSALCGSSFCAYTHTSSRFCCTTCLSLYGPSRDCFLGR